MALRLQPETALIRELLRESPERAGLRDLVGRRTTFDWDYFEECLFRSRVVPAVASRLQREGSLRDLFPEAIVARIEEDARKTAARNLFKEWELAGVIEAFRAEGLPNIVLKGLPFGERFYGNSSLREVRDLDILVPPEGIERGERVLRDLGYSLFEGIHSRSYYRRHHFHVVYVRRGLGIDVVELHWNLLPHPGNLHLDTATLFRDCREYEYRGSRVRVLAPVDETAYLAASLRMAQFVSLKRLLDMERLLRAVRYDVALHEVIARGAEWGIAGEIRTALFIYERFWGGPESGVAYPRSAERFASRLHGSDFFGLGAPREIRLRIWAAYHFAKRPERSFLRRLLWPDDDFRAKMYYDEEPRVPARARVRRFLSGIVAAVDLGWNLLLSGVRRFS